MHPKVLGLWVRGCPLLDNRKAKEAGKILIIQPEARCRKRHDQPATSAQCSNQASSETQRSNLIEPRKQCGTARKARRPRSCCKPAHVLTGRQACHWRDSLPHKIPEASAAILRP